MKFKKTDTDRSSASNASASTIDITNTTAAPCTEDEADVSEAVADIPQNTTATANRLMGYLARQKGRLAVIILAAFFSSFAYAAMPITVGFGIDRLLKVLQSGAGQGELLTMATDALLLPVFLLLISAVSTCLLSYLQQYVVASVGEKLTLSLRQDISAKINRLPLNYFDTHKTGDIMSRATNDLEKVSEVMQVGLMQFITSCFTILLTFLAMLFLNPKLFAVVLVTVGISMVATRFVSRATQMSYAANQAAVGELNEKLEEMYSGNRILKVFNQQAESIDTVCELNNKQFRANRKAQFSLYAIYPAIRLINETGFMVTAVVGGMMALNGSISLGAVQAFLQYVNQVAEPVTQMSYVITSLQGAIAGAERVFTLLDEEEEIADTSSSSTGDIGDGRVQFNHVRFGYNPQKMLMTDLNLEVKPNEMVAIVGPTGGGKTTLVNLLMRFYELNGGTICIDGMDITSMSRGELRRRIGMVLQDTWLFEGTIAENLSYGNRNATREQIINAAKAARCDHFIRTLPQGYDTVISSESAHISQGQMQLLTIARAMLTNPSIMILDEATSSVDTRTEVEIQKAMTQLMKDKTSFVIAHRLSTIKNADMILVVKDGDIIERGTHEGLLEQKGFYSALYSSQFEGSDELAEA